MKTTTFFVLSLLLVASLPGFAAINYTITFTGTGASTTVESVIVQNLTKGTTVTVPTGNSLNLSDAPNAVEQLNANDETIHVYPNLIEGKSTVSFFAKQAGVTQLNAFSIDGRKIAGITENLQTGVNSFQLSLPKGSFVIQVVGNGYSYTAKMINQTGTVSKPEIAYIGTVKPATSNPQKSKSSTPGTTTLNYARGDQLLYKGTSGNYSTIITDIPTGSKNMNFDFVTCQDADLNNYSVVTIGKQTWMASNLRVTHYRNGESISNLTADAGWAGTTFGAWCDYSNSADNGTKYGHLYNWYAASDRRNIAPVGWHVPTELLVSIAITPTTPYVELITFLGGESVAGGKLKEAGTLNWASPNTAATNETGFSALPGGGRDSKGSFYDVGYHGYWWSSSEGYATTAWGLSMGYDGSGVSGLSKDYSDGLEYELLVGFSVRCVRDNVPTLSTTAASTIAITTATSGGNITEDGGATITARGICWSTTSAPTADLTTKTTETGTTGVFSSSMTNLTASTKYYVRAYATNSVGTAYGAEISFTTLASPVGITDIDGNVYTSVTIGTQTWMVENLKTTHYRNGESITNLTAFVDWAGTTFGVWCDYKNSADNGTKYGHLYNWYAVSDRRNIAPVGWHVPTDAEWTTLTTYLGGDSVAGGKLKEAGTGNWLSPNTGATNETGFSARAGGNNCDTVVTSSVTTSGYWWSSSESDAKYAWYRSMYYNDGGVFRNYGGFHKTDGHSVRCVRDN